ncbi:dihydropteroate synthase [Desulfatitalea alkaliphila]|uniref:Dihydropteroate synthase n=1 Tax=Desulfatitalea alkaliphila TaxID=2929485 RepID=A0AA41UI57_9BACT|nr:dihydropteroate synthase [Desulfatitalea alkaliphila]MCJ8500400.1 dihydropteroate synthase [Desulfatitalea alkaliphila]
MIVVGELINTSRRSIAEAVRSGDRERIQAVARAQAEAGAAFIDVNAGTFVEKETDYLLWLVETVQAVTRQPLCLDSPNPAALDKAMAVHQGVPMINSISLEPERYEAMLPLVLDRPCKVVALCMGQTAMPTTAAERMAAADELIGRLTAAGKPVGDIFVDPLIQPVSVDTQMGRAALEAIAGIKGNHPSVNTICGLSNISFGLPERKRINRSFLALAMHAGLDAAILDPTDPQLRASRLTTAMVLGEDPYCEAFIEAYEQGWLA